jgi:alpha-galactosidase
MPNGIYRLSKFLKVDHRDIEATASGINHFTFFTEMRHRRTGEDLLARLREMFARPAWDYSPQKLRAVQAAQRFAVTGALADELYMPLVVHVVRTYGLIPCSIDSHIGEYVDFALDVTDWHPVPLDFHEPVSLKGERLATWAATTKVPIPLQAMGHSHEEVVPIIAAMWSGEPTRIMAVNVPNQGFIPDVKDGAIVEVGATVDGDGIHPEQMPALGEPLAGWIGTQVDLQDKVVDAALQRDPALAFEALKEDPNSPADEAACRKMFDELLALQSDLLPF